MDEAEEEGVELVAAGGEAPEALKPAEQPLDDVALFVEFTVVLPEFAALRPRRPSTLFTCPTPLWLRWRPDALAAVAAARLCREGVAEVIEQEAEVAVGVEVAELVGLPVERFGGGVQLAAHQRGVAADQG